MALTRGVASAGSLVANLRKFAARWRSLNFGWAMRLVVSRQLCKRFERVLIPVNVHTVKDAEKDAFTTVA
ncbi:MAG: hypothetical protein KGR98_03690, partial [Verrucomicrobia bacterium]|nr:hypothetical protein [Verrucomicrobiota bacterium]